MYRESGVTATVGRVLDSFHELIGHGDGDGEVKSKG